MWLLEPSFEREFRARLKTVGKVSADQFDQFASHVEKQVAAAGDGPRNLNIAGDVAEVAVHGVLTQKLDFFLWLFDIENTTYEDIESALATAAADPSIKRIVLDIDSPGGEVKGLFDTLAALDAFPKKKSVRASLAASAAYGIAALGGNIEAANAAATFGSVGVVISYLRDEELIEITSTEAPDKRPDPSTEEGKAVIREYLDAVHQLFAEAIARGRGTTVANVNENFGRGAVMLAAEAKSRGMIDKAPKALKGPKTSAVADVSAETPTAAPAATDGTRPMNKDELKAKHPDLYAAILKEGHDAAFEEGQTAGVAKERKRACALLKMGDSTGATKVANDAIRAGSSVMDEDVHADFMTAAMNRKDQGDRQDDSDTAGDSAGSSASAAAAGKETKPSLVSRAADAMGL